MDKSTHISKHTDGWQIKGNAAWSVLAKCWFKFFYGVSHFNVSNNSGVAFLLRCVLERWTSLQPVVRLIVIVDSSHTLLQSWEKCSGLDLVTVNGTFHVFNYCNQIWWLWKPHFMFLIIVILYKTTQWAFTLIWHRRGHAGGDQSYQERNVWFMIKGK